MSRSLNCAHDLLVALMLLLLPLEVRAFSSGAPLASCEGMVPTDFPPQNSAFPYNVTYTNRFCPDGKIRGARSKFCYWPVLWSYLIQNFNVNLIKNTCIVVMLLRITMNLLINKDSYLIILVLLYYVILLYSYCSGPDARRSELPVFQGLLLPGARSRLCHSDRLVGAERPGQSGVCKLQWPDVFRQSQQPQWESFHDSHVDCAIRLQPFHRQHHVSTNWPVNLNFSLPALIYVYCEHFKSIFSL